MVVISTNKFVVFVPRNKVIAKETHLFWQGFMIDDVYDLKKKVKEKLKECDFLLFIKEIQAIEGNKIKLRNNIF